MKIKVLSLTFVLFFSSLALYGQDKNYWQQEVEYQMEIDVDAENHQFTGSQTLTYHNNSPDTLQRVFYHLYFNAFQPNSMMDVRSRTIEDPDSRVRDRIQQLPEDEIGYHHINSLQQDGSDVEYTVDGTILEVNLNEPILPGESTVFSMDFDSQVPRQIRRSGWMNKEGVEFSMSQWYPKISEYDEDGWHPNPYVAREFHGVWGSFDVKIHIDSSYVMGATGHLQNPKEIGHGYTDTYERPDSEKIIWHWQADKVHDFVWGADPDFTHTTKQIPDGPTLHFLYQTDPVAENANSRQQRQLLENWKQLPEYAAQAFQFVSKNYGKYPYDKYSFIQGGDGGMEYPMATLITGNRSLRSLVGVSVHELIHAWYQGVLANNESRYPWIDEGFTSYVSAKTMNQLFNNGESDNPHRGSYRSYFNIVDAGMEEALDIHADHFETNRGYGVASYSKGAIFLHQLEYIIGKKALDRTMNRFFQEWKFKHPDGRDFLRIAEEESNMILDWYYQYFIETTKTIDYGITSVIADEGQTRITLERHNLMPMPIDLMVTYKDGSQELFYIPLRIMHNVKPQGETDVSRTIVEDWPWVNPTYTLTIDNAGSDIEHIEIEPSERMADIDRSNNTINLTEEED
ncbi:M1 family metallopeptidase [Aliifodinibius salicampi]|uniref:M1 family metallopeptidase n=1 Tax=Fodinibius salicampi TaxID=1920655 RepID=A0ABT3Q0V2_9BACT|nr:M1 family metallopeptidase [Fodinibius salicampi]MCW9713711.1 M1 family metallopeptidase [Fodinibius salicampi]